MRRADRLFELIHLLRRARKAITAVQLAEALEVSPRTIYRDIAALMAMRVPIDGAAGVGYIMRPGYDLPPLMFDREEVEAVAVGLQLLNRTGDQDLQAAARRVAAKIAGVLPELRADELDDGRFVVSDFGTPAAADMGMLRSAVRLTVPRCRHGLRAGAPLASERIRRGVGGRRRDLAPRRDARIFVTPNPSPANAACSLAVLVGWFDALADFLPPVRGEGAEGGEVSLISWTQRESRSFLLLRIGVTDEDGVSPDRWIAVMTQVSIHHPMSTAQALDVYRLPHALPAW